MDISVREFIDNFTKGNYHICESVWYDWFCRNSALADKTITLGKKVVQLARSPKIDLDKHYVWFKNNCPCTGPLYDDFRIADIVTGDVQFCVCHLLRGVYGVDNSRWEIWDYSPTGDSGKTKKPTMVGTWKDVKKYFGV